MQICGQSIQLTLPCCEHQQEQSTLSLALRVQWALVEILTFAIGVTVLCLVPFFSRLTPSLGWTCICLGLIPIALALCVRCHTVETSGTPAREERPARIVRGEIRRFTGHQDINKMHHFYEGALEQYSPKSYIVHELNDQALYVYQDDKKQNGHLIINKTDLEKVQFLKEQGYQRIPLVDRARR